MPQNVRNIFDETGEWARLELRPPPPVHRQRRLSSCRSSRAPGGLIEGALGGWRVNAIFIAQIGAPFTVNLGVDRANIGAGPAQRPDQLRDPNLPGGERTPDRWFDTSALRAARRRSPSAARRATASSARATPTSTSRWRRPGGCRGTSVLEFRWEIFNLLNRANFDLPNRIFGSPNFGRIFSAKNPREMQFGVRVVF